MAIYFNEHLKFAWWHFITDKDWVRQSLASPEACSVFTTSASDGLDTPDTFVVAYKLVGEGEAARPILTVAKQKQDDFEVCFALAAPRELHMLSRSPDPLHLLEALAAKFGEPIGIGDRVSTFFRDQLVSSPSNSDTNVMRGMTTESFALFTMCKVFDKGGTRYIHIAFAFALNTERYGAWLGIETHTPKEPAATKPILEPRCFISEPLRGGLGIRALLEASALMFFDLRLNTLTEGFLFLTECQDFHLSLGIESGALCLRRNSEVVKVEIPKSLPPLIVCVRWLPSGIELGITLPDNTQEFKKVDTPATRPPNSLLRWARRTAIAPVALYETPGALYEVVTDAIESLQDKITQTGMYTAFWDYASPGSQAPPRPKKEIHIHPILEALLSDIALAKNLDIMREVKLGTGALDFLIKGQVSGQGSIPVCIEFKHAHSPHLSHGVEAQLPRYMDTAGADFGIYCVLWFRGEEFNEPSKTTEAELSITLGTHRIRTGRNIRVIILDLSRPVAPSKKVSD